MRRKSSTLALIALLAGGLLSGCGGGDGSAPVAGRFSLAVTDAPVDRAAGLFLTLTGVALQGVAGSRDQGTLAVPEANRLVNLMDFTGTGRAVLVSGLEVEAGTYKLRLDADLTFTADVQRSWIAFASDAPECQALPEGALWSPDLQTCRYPLRIPSGEQSGFKPKGDVTVAAGGTSAFTVEFDLRKNVVDPQGRDLAYLLKPTGLRLVDDAAVGTVTGAVDPSLFGPSCPAADARVYLFERSGQADPFVPDDMHPQNGSLVTSVAVSEVAAPTGATYRYLVGFVPAGTYGVALTCQAEDDPDLDEGLSFPTQADGVAVTAGAEAVQDLPPAP